MAQTKIKKIIGIDQGRDTYYFTILEFHVDFPKYSNIVLADTCGHNDVLSIMNYHNVDLGVLDNEPDRLAARELMKESGGKLILADQREIEDSYKLVKVKHGEIEIDVYAISNIIYQERVMSGFADEFYRISGKVHRNFKKHITGISRDLDTGKFIRPSNHEDDFFYSLVFGEFGKDIFKNVIKPPAISSFVGSKLKKVSF